MYVEGMSEISCDRTVVVGNYLTSDQMSHIYVYHGPAPRISNKYFYRDGVYQPVDRADRGNILLDYCLWFFNIISKELHVNNSFIHSFIYWERQHPKATNTAKINEQHNEDDSNT